ncbi:MAG: hypothetical protein KatS3mg129_1202 [Leptospiraceae bacterium]|nr:MAG: hypothetical protein KatS3mg129_1202 [Leptospiraceae bacterium]
MKKFTISYSNILMILPGIIGAVVLILIGLLPNDDAYITFTHSKNFALYGKLVWNIYDSERTLGSSTPLFAFLLGILGFIIDVDKIPQIALYINAIFLMGTGIIIYRIVYKETNSIILSFLISLLCSINSYNIKIHSYGFEFALFTFLLFLNIYIYLYKENYNLLDLILPSLLILTRIEGIVIYPLVYYRLFYGIKNKKYKIHYFILPVILVFLYIIFAKFYYDQILPQSINSKKAWKELFPVYPLDKDFLNNFRDRVLIVNEFWGSMLAPILRYGTEPATFIVYKLDINKAGNFLLNSNKSLLNYYIFINLFFLYYFYKNKNLVKLYLFIYTYFFFLFVFYTIRAESWYLPPLLISYLLLYSLGTYFLLKEIINRISQYISLKYVNQIILVLSSIFVILMLGKNYYLINRNKYPFDEYRGILYSPGMRDKVEIERFLAYKDAIEILKKNHIKGEIASPEIGVMGFYYTDGNILDLFGLCSKKVIRYYYEWSKTDKSLPPNLYVLQKTKSEIFIHGYNAENKEEINFLNKYYELLYIHPKYTIFGDPMYIWIRKDYNL